MKEYKTTVVDGVLCKLFEDGKYGTLEWDHTNNKMITIIHDDLESLKIYLKTHTFI